MMALVLQLDVNAAQDPQLVDIPKSHQYYPYIAALVKEGIISGYPDRTFRPNAPVTRSHMAKFIARGFNLPNRELADSSFTDLSKGSEAYTYAATLKFYHITVVDTFKPASNVTRGQVALFILRAVNTAPLLKKEASIPFVDLNVNIASAKEVRALDPRYVDLKIDTSSRAIIVIPRMAGKTILLSSNEGNKKVVVVTNDLQTTVKVVDSLANEDKIASNYHFNGSSPKHGVAFRCEVRFPRARLKPPRRYHSCGVSSLGLFPLESTSPLQATLL